MDNCLLIFKENKWINKTDKDDIFIPLLKNVDISLAYYNSNQILLNEELSAKVRSTLETVKEQSLRLFQLALTMSDNSLPSEFKEAVNKILVDIEKYD